METTFFFVRHAEPNYDNHDDLTRELTEKGLQGSQLLIPFFKNITINKVLSSPYKRSIDTVLPLAQNRQLDIQCIDNLRERKIDDVWIEDFNAFAKQQWEDKTFKLANGESLQEVQKRQVATINSLLTTTWVIRLSSVLMEQHYLALSTITIQSSLTKILKS